MFMAMFPELVYDALKKDTQEKFESSSDVRKIIFERLTVGINVTGIDVYQELAEWLLLVPEKKLKTLTVDEVIKGVGEYRDLSGTLL